MSNEQPEALQYADEIDRDEQFHLEEAVAELRRLHAVNQTLVEALQNILTWDDGNLPGDILDEARAVLAKVQGEGK